jgi:hypothetical protein
MISPGWAPQAGDADADTATYEALLAAHRALAVDIQADPATMARGLDAAYRLRPHLRIIGAAMAGVLRREYDRLLILTPPQVGKSTTVAEWGPFWWWTHRPEDDIAIVSYGADLAENRSKRVRALVEAYGADYGLALQHGSKAVGKWQLECGGSLRAVGVGGGLTGLPINVMVVDDPHKDRAEAESDPVRNAVHTWWSSTGSTRLQPDMGAVIAVHTRWHPDDFAGRRLREEGRIEDGGRWKVVHLPAFADPRFGPDPMGRAAGEPLTHPKIPTRDSAALVAWWQKQKAESTVRDWYALYQGDPQPPAGTLVTEALLESLRHPQAVSPAERIAVAIDPSGGGRSTAGIIGGHLGEDQRLWITDDETGVMDAAQWSMAACRLAHRLGAVMFVVEINYGGDMAKLALATAWEKLQQLGEIPPDQLMPLIKTVRAKQNKVLRAEPIAQQMHMDKIRFGRILLDVEKEWAGWVATDKASPGRIDASVYLAYALLPIPITGAAFAVPVGHIGGTTGSPLGTQSTRSGGFGPLG